ncbi:putative integrase/recombinase [Sulfobacillus acidophilus TPY]|nr:putative integrase/recombinase [Sulfobacillus acidophilus TPY]
MTERFEHWAAEAAVPEARNDDEPLPALVQGFFLERLMTQRNASPATVSAYRDTFRLLLRYLADQQQCPATTVTMDMLHADTILAFLNDLEVRR